MIVIGGHIDCAVGPGAECRGALGRPHRVGHPRRRRGPGAARRGAWGARTVRATAAAVGFGGEGGGKGQNVIHDELSKYQE